MVASHRQHCKGLAFPGLIDQLVGSERARVERAAMDESAWSGGGECAICSISSVSCSVRYSWFLVPRSSDLARDQSMVPGCLPALTGWTVYLASDIRRCVEYVACHVSKPLSGCVEAPALLAWSIGIQGDSSEIQFLVCGKTSWHGRTSRAYSSWAPS